MKRPWKVMTMLRRLTIVALVALAAATAAARSDAGGAGRVDPDNFVRSVDNPWYPLRPGTTYVFSGAADGKRIREVMTVLRQPKTILGVHAAVVRDNVYEDGHLTEATRDWYAQDRKGNVWYFGEATAELDRKGHVKTREGSWKAGVDGAEPGIVMPAHPKVGQAFRQEYYKGHAEDHFEIESLSARVKTTYVSTRHAMRTKEWSPLEPGATERKYYVRGIGLVSAPADHVVLVSVEKS
jgi:hypothetical protein